MSAGGAGAPSGGIELEVVGSERAPDAPSRARMERLCTAVAQSRGALEGHLAIEFVSPQRIAQLNERHRGRQGPTDVLSFPIDELEPQPGVERELGDVVICPEHTADIGEAIVHGVLHLLGMDHETDDGEMLALQEEILAAERAGGAPGPAAAGSRPARRDTAPDGAAVSADRVPEGRRAGFLVLAGRPNVGKSTLLNALVGEKVAIVSEKPQTTRRAIRGVLTQGDHQIVFVDLPGVQRPRDQLTARMARRVQQELDGADAALLVINASEGVGPGDRFTARALAAAGLATTIAVNKIDMLRGGAQLPVLSQAAELGLEGEIFPVSARTGEGLAQLAAHLGSLMPEGPFLFERGASSDQPLELLVAELVREAAIRRTFDELPHAVETVVEDIERRPDGLTKVTALIWVETESQKRIVVGAGGKMVKAIGTAARREMERELGGRVHLELVVRVRRGWREDESLLDRLGIG